MRRLALLTVEALLLCLPVWSEAQDFIRYFPPSIAPSGGTMTGPLLLPDGSTTAPSLAFSTGLPGFFRSGNYIYWRESGITSQRIGYYSVMTAGGIFGFTSSTTDAAGTIDTRIERDAAAKIQLGADAATAVSNEIKGADSTGANIVGANLTLRGGSGTAGNATGGNLILGGGANAGSGERGAVLLEDGGTRPTCAAGIRGAVWYDAGGAGAADTLEVCRKDASNNYAWAALF